MTIEIVDSEQEENTISVENEKVWVDTTTMLEIMGVSKSTLYKRIDKNDFMSESPFRRLLFLRRQPSIANVSDTGLGAPPARNDVTTGKDGRVGFAERESSSGKGVRSIYVRKGLRNFRIRQP